MTATPATPQPKQWKVSESDSESRHTILLETSLGDSPLIIFNHLEGGPWFVKSKLGYWIRPATVTTAEQAVAEAVVALSQHLDWLREELAAIPLTFPTTPAA